MFNIGDSVKISKDSDYYEDDNEFNPTNLCGVITSKEIYEGSMLYVVLWHNGKENDYREEDLELELVHKDVQFHIQPVESMKEVVYFGQSFMIPKDHNYMVITSAKSIKSFKTKPFFGFFWSSKDGECSEIAPEGSCTIHIDIRETLKEV